MLIGLSNAKRGGRKSPPGRSSAPPPEDRFHGSGQTLGGDDTPSEVIPGPSSRSRPSSEPISRVLHLWNDGFSVEDGPLRRFDDAQNAADLAMIRSGRAPLHLMGVESGQTVDVQLQKHDTDYKEPPKVYKPFGGGGRRLGSPTPGPPMNFSPINPPAPASEAAPTTSISDTPVVATDPSAPTLALRIQMADGTRLPVRFNLTQTIGDVYNFVAQASGPEAAGRPWVLATTFPNKDHIDKSLVLGELAEFKRGGTAVQKWA